MNIKKLAILFTFVLVLATVLSAGEQKTCPVMGGEIDKNLFAEQDGEKIYVCCEGCIEEVNKDFDKYKTKLEESGQSVEVVKKSECKTGGEKECCKPKAHECQDCKDGTCDGSCKTKTAETPKKCCSSTAQANAPKKCCGSK